MVAAHLKKWRTGDRTQYLNLLGQGCFCPWTKTKKTAELI
jgi:hypothetical protein